MDLTAIEQLLRTSPDWCKQTEEIFSMVTRVIKEREEEEWKRRATEIMQTLFAEHVKGKTFDPSKVRVPGSPKVYCHFYRYQHDGVDIQHQLHERYLHGDYDCYVTVAIIVDGKVILDRKEQ
jgi:hypothetical protein